ncbi:uncharacterized protein LOC117255173 isoform X1 [Epinephelus lanceolatus]
MVTREWCKSVCVCSSDDVVDCKLLLLLRVLTSMGQWKLWFVLLLQLTVSVDSKEKGQQLVKTIGREPDVTPICTNATEHVIILIVCWIRTERSGEECRLLYRHGEDSVHECDSRFTLLEKNQTVFLHVTSLTPEDSGNYTCQCSHTGGTDTLCMNITVEGKEDEDTSRSTHMQIPSVLIDITTVIIVTGVFFVFICKIIHHGCCSRSATSGLSETPGSLDRDDPDDPYTSLQQPGSEVYQSVSNSANNTFCLDNQEVDGGETDPICKIYDDI